MNTPIQKSELRQGVTVYQLVEPGEEQRPINSNFAPHVVQSSEDAYAKYSAIFALATSLLMLGIAWLLVHYWNMLTG